MRQLSLFIYSFCFATAIGVAQEIEVDLPEVICQGDSILITASMADGDVLWNNDNSSESQWIFESGTYYFDADNGRSDTLEITFNPVPTPLANPEHVTCHGGTDGFIEVFSTHGVPIDNIIWSNRQEGSSVANLIAGTYTYVFTDINGCSTLDSVEIFEPNPINIETEVIGSTITASIEGGTPPYTYFWNGEEGTDSFDLNELESVVLEVIDIEDCSESITITGVSEEVGIEYSLMHGRLSFNHPESGSIMSVNGQVLQSFLNVRTIDLRSYQGKPIIIRTLRGTIKLQLQ